MTRATARYMPFFGEDFFRDTAHLSKVVQNCYLRLLWHAWTQDGTVPDDPEELANICGEAHSDFAEKIWPKLARFFDPANADANADANAGADGGRKLTQKKLLAEYQRVLGVSAKRSEAARASHAPDAQRVVKTKKTVPPKRRGPSPSAAIEPADADPNAPASDLQLQTEYRDKNNNPPTPQRGARGNVWGFPRQARTEVCAKPAWAKHITIEERTGKRLVMGFRLDVVMQEAMDAARIDGSKVTSVSVTEEPLVGWLVDGYHADSIIEIISEIARSPSYRSPFSLKFFDGPIRQRGVKVDEWRRRRLLVPA